MLNFRRNQTTWKGHVISKNNILYGEHGNALHRGAQNQVVILIHKQARDFP